MDAVYYLPRLREWFVESTLYPFIGGNTVRAVRAAGARPAARHQPHPPLRLPLLPGRVQRGGGVRALPGLPGVRPGRDLHSGAGVPALYGRNLTLSRLPEAIILPLCPDKGTCLAYDPTLAASVYLENDLEQLMRTHSAL